MGLDSEIRQRLTKAFAPTHLEVLNESALHAGHSGDDGSGESHWRIVIAAEAFAAQTRLQRHRSIHAAIGPDVIARIHALAIEIV